MLLYADRVTDNMQRAMDETRRRRTLQEAYNAEHGILPRTIIRPVDSPLAALVAGDFVEVALDRPTASSRNPEDEGVTREDAPKQVARLRKEMRASASRLEFERAAELRDRIVALEQWMLETPR